MRKVYNLFNKKERPPFKGSLSQKQVLFFEVEGQNGLHLVAVTDG